MECSGLPDGKERLSAIAEALVSISAKYVSDDVYTRLKELEAAEAASAGQGAGTTGRI